MRWVDFQRVAPGRFAIHGRVDADRIREIVGQRSSVDRLINPMALAPAYARILVRRTNYSGGYIGTVIGMPRDGYESIGTTAWKGIKVPSGIVDLDIINAGDARIFRRAFRAHY